MPTPPQPNAAPPQRANLPHTVPMFYADMPVLYVWDQKKCEWAPRAHQKRGEHILGRLYSAGSREGERYYLRVLLQHIPDATSFEDLLLIRDANMVPNQTIAHHRTYQDAVFALGLMDDDQLARETFDEAVRVIASPSRLHVCLSRFATRIMCPPWRAMYSSIYISICKIT